MLQGFDKDYYLNVKLSSLQTDLPEWQSKDTRFLENFLLQVKMTPETHYSLYGYKEGLSPNAYFSHEEYRFAKAAQMLRQGSFSDMESALDAFNSAWSGDPYLHYLQYGAAEGINPSNAFDENQYLENKLNALKNDPLTSAEWTGKDVTALRDLFSAIGLTGVTHFLQYGLNEGLKAPVVSPSEQVDPTNRPWALPHNGVVIPSELSLEWVNSNEITTLPYSSVGLVVVTVDGLSAIGSGVLVSPEHVLTAAHVVLGEAGTIDSSTEINFYPAINDDFSTSPHWQASHVTVQKTFSNFDLYPTWPDDDLAVLHLKTPVDDAYGYLSPLPVNPATMIGSAVSSSGYPSQDIVQDNPLSPGQDIYQWEISGILTEQYYGEGALLFSDSMASKPGASGSPIFYTHNQDVYVIGTYAGTVGDTPASAALDPDSFYWLLGILQQDGYYYNPVIYL